MSDNVSFDSYLEGLYPHSIRTMISDTNNQVAKVSLPGSGDLIVKRMVDADIPLTYLAEASAYMATKLPVQRIYRLLGKADGAPFDCVVTEYVEGNDLATALNMGPLAPSDEFLSRFMIDYLDACATLPGLFEGFGMYKTNSVKFESHAEFLVQSAEKYWRRARPFFSEAGVVNWVDKWINQGLTPGLASPGTYQMVAIDSNLRNYIVRPDGRIILLNVPIVARSSRVHAVAAISAHLRNLPVRKVFETLATEGFSPAEKRAVKHLELWTLLGILSFYAVRQPERARAWRNWGAPMGLREDFSVLVRELADGPA